MCMVALVCIVLIALHSHVICTFKGELTYKMTCLFEVVSACYRDSSPKNGHSVINYLASCHSKPMIILFIFRTQIKIFLMESESFLSALVRTAAEIPRERRTRTSRGRRRCSISAKADLVVRSSLLSRCTGEPGTRRRGVFHNKGFNE